MSLFYPMQTYGGFGLSYGLTPSLLHSRYGLDYGERFHRDIEWRIAQVMEIDRHACRDFGQIGLGFDEPFPRATIEPFGHRFVPAVFGCAIVYASSEDPAAVRREFDSSLIRGLRPWTRDRLESCARAMNRRR